MIPHTARAAVRARWPLHPDIIAKQAAGALLLRARKERADALVRAREADKVRKKEKKKAERKQWAKKRNEAATSMQAAVRAYAARRDAKQLEGNAIGHAAALLQARWRGAEVRSDAELQERAEREREKELQRLRNHAHAILEHNQFFLDAQLSQRLEKLQTEARAEGARKAAELLHELRAIHALRAALADGDADAARWAGAIVLQRAWARRKRHELEREEARARLEAKAQAARSAMSSERITSWQMDQAKKGAALHQRQLLQQQQQQQQQRLLQPKGKMMPMHRPVAHAAQKKRTAEPPPPLLREASIDGLRSALAHNCSRVIDIFRSFDRDESGTVSAAEFKAALPLLLGLDAREVSPAMDALFARIDEDGSGTLEYAELHKLLRQGASIELATELRDGAMGEIERTAKNNIATRSHARDGSFVGLQPVSSKAELRQALLAGCGRVTDLFKALDHDSDRRVTRREFRAALPLLGFDSSCADSRAACDQIFDELDVDLSGYVEYAEMQSLLGFEFAGEPWPAGVAGNEGAAAAPPRARESREP